MFNRKIFLLLLPLFVGLGSLLPAQTLHLIMVVQMNDSLIGGKMDSMQVSSEVATIANNTGLKFERHFFNQDQLTAYRFKSFMQNFQCEDQDVVWFYYSGHGEKEACFQPPYPSFSLSSSCFLQNRIHSKLLAKSPRLLITLYDCCAYDPRLKTPDRIAKFALPKAANHKKLFLNTRGHLLLQSNDPDKSSHSYGNNEMGGVYTFTFFEQLSKLSQGSLGNCRWDSLLSATSRETQIIAQNSDLKQVPRAEKKLQMNPPKLYPKTLKN
jgi:hypothetical protein